MPCNQMVPENPFIFNYHVILHFSGVCPLLCSGHGVYGGGQCHCVDGWKGTECDVRDSECIIPDCSSHGHCQEGVCICKLGWTGEHCQISKHYLTKLQCLFGTLYIGDQNNFHQNSGQRSQWPNTRHVHYSTPTYIMNKSNPNINRGLSVLYLSGQF